MINDVSLYGIHDDKASEQHNGCASQKRPVIYLDEKGSTFTYPHPTQLQSSKLVTTISSSEALWISKNKDRDY